MFNFLKKKSVQGKILLTSRGFSGTIFLLSLLSNLKNSSVAWNRPGSNIYSAGITLFGDESNDYIANETEIDFLPPAKIFSRLVAKHPANDLYCIGHWHNLHDAETKYGRRYFIKNNIHSINLIRHPVARTHSHWHNLLVAHAQGMSEDHKQGFMGTINNQKDWLYDFLKEYNVSIDNIDEATFIVACLNLFGCSLDASYKQYQHIKIESLNNTALAIFINEISKGKIKLNEDDIIKIKTIKNSHLETFHQKLPSRQQYNDAATTDEKYLSWLPWQKELYKTCIKKSKLDEYYKEFHYDLYI